MGGQAAISCLDAKASSFLHIGTGSSHMGMGTKPHRNRDRTTARTTSMAAPGTRKVSQEQGHLEEPVGVGGQLCLRQEAPPFVFLSQRELCRHLRLANP